MRKFVVVVGGFVVLTLIGAVVVDLVARRVAAEHLREELAVEVPEARQVTASVEGFPFVLALLTTGRVERITAELQDYRHRDVEFSNVHIEIDGLQLDRDRLLGERRLLVTGIDRARVEAQTDEAAISRLLGVPVSLDDGSLYADIGGRRVEARVKVDGRRLRIQVVGGPNVTLALPDREVLPCSPRLRIRRGFLSAECELDRLPSALAAGLGGG